MNHYAKREQEKPLFVRIMYWCICLVLLLMFLLLFWVPMNAQERSNTYYAAQFQGADAGTKIANAQAACSPNTAIPCIIVIDAILAGWPQGTTPAKCSNCVWLDYRNVYIGESGINGVLFPSTSNGLASTLNLLPTNGGPVWLPAGYNETTTSTVNVGVSGHSQHVQSLGNNILTIGVTDGVSDGVDIHNGSSFAGVAMGPAAGDRSGASTIKLATNANLVNVVSTGEANQAFFTLQKTFIDDSGTDTVSGSFVNIAGLNGNSIVRDVTVNQCKTTGFLVTNTSTGFMGPLTLDNDWADCSGNTGGQPLSIFGTSGNFGVVATTALGGAWVHPGTGLANVKIDGNSLANTVRSTVLVNDYTEELAHANGIAHKIVDAYDTILLGGEYLTNQTGTTDIDISERASGNTKGVIIIGASCFGSSLVCLNNHITGTSLGTSRTFLPFYIYGGRNGTNVGLPVVFEAVDFKINKQDGTNLFNFDGVSGQFKSTTYATQTNCASTIGACSSAPAGAVTIAAAATTVTVSTTAVTANSEIYVQETPAYSTRLSVTCNSTTGRTYTVTTITAGSSFVITASAAPTTNPACLSFNIVN